MQMIFVVLVIILGSALGFGVISFKMFEILFVALLIAFFALFIWEKR